MLQCIDRQRKVSFKQCLLVFNCSEMQLNRYRIDTIGFIAPPHRFRFLLGSRQRLIDFVASIDDIEDS